MAKFITIDCGTTNTRIALVDNMSVIRSIKLSIGAGRTAQTGNCDELKAEISNGIRQILGDTAESEISAVYASGMITSELGLFNIEHIRVPVGPSELKNGAKTVLLEDVSHIPITFIPGVKNDFDSGNIKSLEDADFMRGEETEAIGLVKIMDIALPVTAVLPGTHTKLVRIDAEGRIVHCCTALSGELYNAVITNTILKNCIADGAGSNDTEYLEMGYQMSEKAGCNAALFKARVLKNSFGVPPDKTTAFIAGAILYSDIQLILQKAGNDTILIGGSEPLRSSFEHLIRKNMSNRVIVADDEQVKNSTIIGAISIFN